MTEDVFTDAEAVQGRAYGWTNALHITTRAGVIGRFLLFHEGDSFDGEKLVETERNLRKLPFLNSATVTAGEPHDGTVDVTVDIAYALDPDPRGERGFVVSFSSGQAF